MIVPIPVGRNSPSDRSRTGAWFPSDGGNGGSPSILPGPNPNRTPPAEKVLIFVGTGTRGWLSKRNTSRVTAQTLEVGVRFDDLVW
jgi:hypothetical protein